MLRKSRCSIYQITCFIAKIDLKNAYFHLMKISLVVLLALFLGLAETRAQLMELPFELEEEGPQFYKPLGMGNRAIQNRVMEIGLKAPENVTYLVDAFVQLKGSGLNPYNPTDINFYGVFTSPSGDVDRRNGFYFQAHRIDYRKDKYRPMRTEQPWRLRYSPKEEGQYKLQMFFVVKKDTFYHELNFESEASADLGRLIALETGTNKDRILHTQKDTLPYFTIGENISQTHFDKLDPSDNQKHFDGITVLKNSGGNFTRVEISAQGSLPHWDNPTNFTSKQDEMFAFDELMLHLEQKQMYAIVFRHHVEVNGEHWAVANWENNPYHKRFKLSSELEYFKDEEVKKVQKWSLRYQIARWGDAPYFSHYGYSEVDNWYKPLITNAGLSEKEAYLTFRDWVLENQAYVLNECNDDVQFVHSYASIPKLEYRDDNGLLANSDLLTSHKYGNRKEINYDIRAVELNQLYDRFKKPVIIEEFGLDPKFLPLHCCSGYEFHSAMWSSFFMGGTGPGLDWWWNRGIHDFSYIYDIAHMRTLSRNMRWDTETYAPQRYADARVNKRKIESYTLVAESGNFAAGWVKNATIYWRNMAKDYSCIQNLIDSSALNFECFSRDGVAAFHNERQSAFSDPRYEDAYSDEGWVQVGNVEDILANPTIKIEDLNRSKLRTKSWYVVRFYPTDNGSIFRPVTSFTQTLSSSLFGNLQVHVPRMNLDFRDYVYTIEYIGSFKEAPQEFSLPIMR